jgi:CRAL/TRIO domain
MCKFQAEAIAIAREEPIAVATTTLPKQVQSLLDDLSPKEVELAARTSYRYLHHQQRFDQQRATVGSEQQQQRERRHRTNVAAAAMAQRYLTSKSSYERALKGLRATLEFRADRNLDASRAVETMSAELRQNLSNGNAYVTGRDTAGRATLVFTPRLVENHEASVEGLLWTLERAIACSRHADEINAIVDFAGFDLWKHSPPLAVGKAILTLLRNYYVGHVHVILFLNAPASVNYVWNMFKPFAGKSTKDKISFVKSSGNNNNDLTKLYTNDQLPPSILETGSHPEFHPDAYFTAEYDCLQCA